MRLADAPGGGSKRVESGASGTRPAKPPGPGHTHWPEVLRGGYSAYGWFFHWALLRTVAPAFSASERISSTPRFAADDVGEVQPGDACFGGRTIDLLGE